MLLSKKDNLVHIYFKEFTSWILFHATLMLPGL